MPDRNLSRMIRNETRVPSSQFAKIKLENLFFYLAEHVLVKMDSIHWFSDIRKSSHLVTKLKSGKNTNGLCWKGECMSISKRMRS